MAWRKKRENELLANCYRNSLEVAKENGIRRIAFPSISTGMFHYPIDKAADVAIATAKTFLKENPGVFDTVKFVLFDDPTFEEYKKRLI